MNKPIRCTTHFHACDCREYEFEMVKKENEELKRKIENCEKVISAWKDSYTARTDEVMHLRGNVFELKKENEELRGLLTRISNLRLYQTPARRSGIMVRDQEKAHKLVIDARDTIKKISLSGFPNNSKGEAK